MHENHDRCTIGNYRNLNSDEFIDLIRSNVKKQECKEKDNKIYFFSICYLAVDVLDPSLGESLMDTQRGL